MAASGWTDLSSSLQPLEQLCVREGELSGDILETQSLSSYTKNQVKQLATNSGVGTRVGNFR